MSEGEKFVTRWIVGAIAPVLALIIVAVWTTTIHGHEVQKEAIELCRTLEDDNSKIICLEKTD